MSVNSGSESYGTAPELKESLCSASLSSVVVPAQGSSSSGPGHAPLPRLEEIWSLGMQVPTSAEE